MESILAFVTITGFIIGVIILVFTEQGREVVENLTYHIRKFTKKVHVTVISVSRKPIPSAQFEGDRSQFVRDITIPDGMRIKVGQKFRKIWEIQNVGTVSWENRYLQRQGPCDGIGRLRSSNRVRIPYTLPDEYVKIAVNLTAPNQPGSCYAEWKMVDKKGRILLPNQKPVYVAIDVIQ